MREVNCYMAGLCADLRLSPNDKIWGIGFNSEEAMNHVDEWGNNGLGKALMRVRSRLKELNSE